MREITRRDFLKQSALSAAMLSFGGLTAQSKEPEPVRIGIIGTGAQGQNLLRQLVSIPGVELAAYCDLYPPHADKAKEITGGRAQAVQDYRALVERKDIQAVVVATPLYLHAPMTMAALKAGKHVFCEKMMAYTVEGAQRMAKAARESKRILQIGHQRRYSPLYQHALELVNEGVLGQITHIRALWHRNGSWRRSVPDSSLEKLLNWRLYKAYSHGLMAELGSHQIDVANWFLNTTPVAVSGFGGLDYWKDGREIYDNVNVIYEYPKGVKLIYTSITTNAFDGYGEWIMGDKGTLVITSENKAMLYREPHADKLDWQDSAKREKIDGREAIVVDASATRKPTGPGEQVQVATSRNAYYLELEHFVHCVRTGERPLCTAQEALPACVAAIVANQAMEKAARLKFKRSMFEIA